jgi:Ni,Fe-hydrogenase III large subunit
VRLEARLGYTHKGTLTLMRGKSPRTAARFAARLSGEATVAHGIAFARATEAALATDAARGTRDDGDAF